MFNECPLMSFIVVPSPEDNLKNELKDSLNSDKNNNTNKDINTANEPDYNRLNNFYSTEHPNVTNKNYRTLAKKPSLYKKYINLIYLMPNESRDPSPQENKIIVNSLCYKSSLSLDELNNDNNDTSSSMKESSSLSMSTITIRNDISNIYQDLVKLYLKFSKSLNDLIKNKGSIISNLRFMFFKCESLVYISGISKWDLSECTDISGLFEKCSSLEYIPDISKWDTKNIQIAARVFSDCSV